MNAHFRRDESWMGRHVKSHKPRVNVNSILSRMIGRRVVRSLITSLVPREEFPDVSFYQGKINWETMRAKARKVIIRAGQNVWIDILFKVNYAAAKLLGFLRGVYWFYDGRVSPQEQLQKLIEALNGDLPELGIWVDWERSYNGAHEGLRNVVAFMQIIERAFPGVEVGLYTGYYFFIENSNPITNAAQYLYLAKKKLWLAFYALLEAVRIPRPFTAMKYWQKGTPARGKEYGVETIEIDMNEDMEGDVTPPHEPEDPMPTTGQGRVRTLTNIRNSPPGGSYNDIGDLHEGDIVTWDRAPLYNNVIWYHLTNATRNNQPVITLGGLSVSQRQDCWAYGVNIEPIETPPPQQRTVTKAIVHFSDGTVEEVFPR